MNIYKSLQNFQPPQKGIVLTIGNFDGVHKGHQAIIKQALSISRETQIPMVAMTFEPAPVKILCPDKAPERITPLAIKIKLLDNLGVDNLLIIKPEEKLLKLTPKQFIQQMLIKQLHIRYIVEGGNFNFGYNSSGNTGLLQQTGQKEGFKAITVQPQTTILTNGQPVTISSTLIRKLIQNGQLQLAHSCLNRPFILAGQIVQGRGVGYEIGVPTANLKLLNSDQLIPPDGVFAGQARIADNIDQTWQSKKYYPAAISIGPCATFTDGKWQIEAHLLDIPNIKTDLRGKFMVLELYSKIRDQKKFANLNELVLAINHDCTQIKEILKKQKYASYIRIPRSR